MDIMKPFLNINGTSSEQLVEARLKAREACLSLIKIMEQVRPHARDYIGHNDQYDKDLNVHNQRVSQIDALGNNLLDEAYDILQRADQDASASKTSDEEDVPASPSYTL